MGADRKNYKKSLKNVGPCDVFLLGSFKYMKVNEI